MATAKKAKKTSAPTYVVRLKKTTGAVVPGSRQETTSRMQAGKLFGHLIGRQELDGQALVAVLSVGRKILAAHLFTAKPGTPDYWRGRLQELPSGKTGRPAEMKDGRLVRVYLDADTIAKAKRAGAGNVSAGIRKLIAR